MVIVNAAKFLFRVPGAAAVAVAAVSARTSESRFTTTDAVEEESGNAGPEFEAVSGRPVSTLSSNTTKATAAAIVDLSPAEQDPYR